MIAFHRIVYKLLVFSGCLLFSQVIAVAQNSSDSGRVINLVASGGNAAGRTAVESLLQALGGASRVNAVRTLHQTMSILQHGQNGQNTSVDQSISYPDKQTQLMSLPDGRHIRFVVTPDSAFSALGSEIHDLAPAQRTASNAALKHDFINVLQHIDDPKYTFQASAKEKIVDIEATIVDVSADGVSTRWWIGPDGRLLQELSSETGPTLMKYSDWKDFAGLKYPTKYEIFDQAGNPRFVMRLVNMEVNAVIDSNLFKKPQ